jgi:AraC family transcriptional regulator of adaptative response / DNA-3-methyladenine glycosylase II
VPGAFDGFELAVRAVLGQQVTVKGARTLAGRFARAFGEPAVTPFPGLDVVFPAPQTVARLDASALAGRGLVGARARSIIVPCHRVVGSDGRLTGYAGGLERKRALLALESGRAARPDGVLVF